MCILHIVFCTVCKYVLSICKLLFFLHCLEHAHKNFTIVTIYMIYMWCDVMWGDVTIKVIFDFFFCKKKDFSISCMYRYVYTHRLCMKSWVCSGGFTLWLRFASPLFPGKTNGLFRLGRGCGWSSKHPVLLLSHLWSNLKNACFACQWKSF